MAERDGPGNLLRSSRESMGVEIREVADALNLAVSVIEAIEANDFDRLPSRVFARGYVRAYSKLVELDPEPIVASFQRAVEPTPDAAVVNPRNSALDTLVDQPGWLGALNAQRRRLEEWVRENPLAALGAAALAMLIFMLLLALVFIAGGDRMAPAAGVQADLSVRPPGAGRAAGTGAGQAGSDGDSRELFAGIGNVVVPGGPGARGDPGHRSLSQVRIGTGTDRLSFAFVADCWVEVRDAEDQIVYSDLGQSGRRLELTGAGPFEILLGYAPGAELAFNGEAVVLAPHTRDNVAKLVVGQ